MEFIERRPGGNATSQAGQKYSFNVTVFWLLVGGGALLLFLVIPLLVLFYRAVPGGALGNYFSSSAVSNALQLSLITTTITLVLAVVLGTPLAYLLARYDFRGKSILDTLIDLPMVLPPAVAGVALLITFGRRGWIGSWLETQFGLTIGFSTAAVVMAQLFVAAPYYIKSARAGFESTDPGYEKVASTLGRHAFAIFWQVTVPLSLPSLLSGMVMSWARALGEFGATIMFAGNFEGKTQTMPLAIYGALEGSSGLDQAMALSVILVIASFAVLLLVKWLARLTLR
ncbi:MAG TPA: ABC transporter permease [Chloroflexia bacterium]|nr:ABC transporter permease [Chloroflexia bacterium]